VLPSFLVASALASSTVSLGANEHAPADVEPVVDAAPQPEHGPAFVPEPVSDTAFATDPRRGKRTPLLSVSDGGFCFVDDAWCRTSLILSASIGLGLRAAGDSGPDIPYAQFMFRGGLVARPLGWSRRTWHPWAVGAVGSWSRGTGSVTLLGEDREPVQTHHTDAWRVGLHNQIWLSKKPHGLHLDFTLGGVRSNVLTSGQPLWGSHAELGVGWGGWVGLFASGDFLDRDTRVVFGLRGHALAAAPIVALALAGMALGGAM
jgi:hypothetical protein